MKKIKFSGLDEYIYTHTLKNGLEIYMIPNLKVNSFYITYNVKFGSIYNSFKKMSDDKYYNLPTGVAHFLEHLTFKMEDMDASDYFSNIGSNSNAFTSFLQTCYEVFGHDKFKDNLSYLIKYVNTPFYTKENVEAEKGIILEEAKMKMDNPSTELYFSLNKALFKNDLRRESVVGELEDIKKISLSDINYAYECFYNPKNTFIVISGNFNQEEAVAIIEEEYSKLDEKGFDISSKKIHEPYKVNESNVVIKRKNIENDKIAIGLKIKKSVFDEFKLSESELLLYISIIINSNFGYSSLLREQLVEGNITNGGIYNEKYFTDEYLIINFIAETNYSNRYISIMEQELSNISIDKDDFLRKKRVLISDYIISFDNVEDINSFVADYIIDYKKIDVNIYDVFNNLDYKIASNISKKLITKNRSIVELKKSN